VRVANSESGNGSDDGALGQVSDLFDLVKGYAKQETIDPLRSAGRFLARGLAGGFLMALGLIMLCFAGLRALQTETHAFDHGWSFVPYFIVVFGASIVAFLFVRRITKGGLDG
jgi:hypothetical protein